jgi:hydroxypyruvate reductase
MPASQGNADQGVLSMKPEILLMEPMMPEIEARLDAAYQVHRLFNAPDMAAELARVGAGIRAIVTGGGTGASNDVMDALPALEIIAINGIGTDAVDLGRARGRGIRVTTTPDVLTDDVADMALALILAVARRICVGDRFVRAGGWTKGGVKLGLKVSGKRLGIVGLGRVGLAIARRAEAFSMMIAYSDLHDRADVSYRRYPTLVELARDSDVLVVAASGGPGSRGVVDAATLAALGPDGVLVNVARGSVVDQPALVAALTHGRLGGAGLDVYAHEPEVPAALWQMDNVVLMPHQASATVETRLAMGDLVLRNVAAQFCGGEPPTAVV